MQPRLLIDYTKELSALICRSLWVLLVLCASALQSADIQQQLYYEARQRPSNPTYFLSRRRTRPLPTPPPSPSIRSLRLGAIIETSSDFYSASQTQNRCTFISRRCASAAASTDYDHSDATEWSLTKYLTASIVTIGPRATSCFRRHFVLV